MSKQAHKCGWCMTGHHASCKPSITYYDRTWECQCPCEKPLGTDNSVSTTPPVVKQPTKETR